MKQTTDLFAVKQQAITFLYLEPEPKAGVGFLIDYPYLDSMFGYLKSSNKMFNVFNDKDDFDLWRVEMMDFIQSKDNVIDIIVTMCRPFRIIFFKYIQEYLDVTDFSNLLREVWIDTEFPALNIDISSRDLSMWLKIADKDILMSKEDKNYLDSLPESVKIYRGVADEQYIEGYSWSLSEEKARWFATRFSFEGCSPVLCSFEINKSDIIAYMSARNEAEVVVLPETLENYKINRLYL